MIMGISNITFVVKNLDRTAKFLTEIFEAKEVYSNSMVKYFTINDFWIALNKGEPRQSKLISTLLFKF